MKLFGQKEPTEMERVMENIAQVEGEIQQKIFQLGQMYYTDHRANSYGDEKYFPMIDLINKLDQNRNGFYKNKLRLEGQMMCVNCGAVIPYGSMFCNVCGKKADEKQDGGSAAGMGATQDSGSAAGMGAAQDSGFAAGMGAVEDGGSAVGMGAAGMGMPGFGAADAAAVNAGERRCISCGAVLEPDSMFCTSCGQKVEA